MSRLNNRTETHSRKIHLIPILPAVCRIHSVQRQIAHELHDRKTLLVDREPALTYVLELALEVSAAGVREESYCLLL